MESKKQYNPILQTSLNDIAMSTRLRNCLHVLGVWKIGQIENVTELLVRTQRNLGKRSYEELLNIMKKYDVHFLPEHKYVNEIIDNLIRITDIDEVRDGRDF